jgi:hypothetical protein
MHFFPIFEKLQPYMRLLDWVAGVGTLVYGLWRENAWWIAAGVIMLALAWFDPGTRIKRWAAFIKPVDKK